jgi:hypothetical protein
MGLSGRAAHRPLRATGLRPPAGTGAHTALGQEWAGQSLPRAVQRHADQAAGCAGGAVLGRTRGRGPPSPPGAGGTRALGRAGPRS